jgi:hypothetical protein
MNEVELFNTSSRKKYYKNVNTYIQKYLIYNKTNGDNMVSFNKFINIYKKLGEGVQGAVYKSGLVRSSKKQFDNTFVIKATNITKGEYNLHNLPFSKKACVKQPYIEIISSLLTNQLVLQKICPNFTLNYNYLILDNCKEKTRISTKKYCTLQFNEYINQGTFADWISKKRSVEMLTNAFFQILSGLYAINFHYNMIHNDFHGENILVQKIKPGGYWIYIINNKKYYVPNLGYVFLIMDFGYSLIPDIMYPDWYVKKQNSNIVLKDYQDIKLTNITIKTWDLKKLIKFTVRGSNKNMLFKQVFLTYFEKLIALGLPQNDIIKFIYGSTNNCNKFPFHCYTSKNYVSGKRIDTFNLNKNLDITKLPTELHKLKIIN